MNILKNNLLDNPIIYVKFNYENNKQKENKMRAKKKPKFSFCNIEIHSKSRGMTQNKLIQERRKKMKNKTYSWLDVATKFVEVCYSCSSQNIKITNDGEKSFCMDCKSEDIGAVPRNEVL